MIVDGFPLESRASGQYWCFLLKVADESKGLVHPHQVPRTSFHDKYRYALGKRPYKRLIKGLTFKICVSSLRRPMYYWMVIRETSVHGK